MKMDEGGDGGKMGIALIIKLKQQAAEGCGSAGKRTRGVGEAQDMVHNQAQMAAKNNNNKTGKLQQTLCKHM